MSRTPNHGEYVIQWQRSITELGQAEWDLLALPVQTPFLEWAWLKLLEESASASDQTGWHPVHLTVRRAGHLVGAAPLYLKWHSQGEFVFDHVWAEVAGKIGASYYPKCVGAVPFTPVSGYAFLIHPEQDVNQMTELMVRALIRMCLDKGVQSIHFHFTDQNWARRMKGYHFLSWEHQAFQWTHQGLTSFDDYLQVFKSSQRKNIKRERRALQEQGVTVSALTGEQVTREALEEMHHFYEQTNDKYAPWNCKFLNRKFFLQLGDHFRHRLLMFRAFKAENALVGASLLVFKGDRLYGRYWGCAEDLPHLHFNLCFYEPIAWAIDNGIHFFDPGIGGGHKVRRGFESVTAYSLHLFFDAQMQKIFELNIGKINEHARQQAEALNGLLPLKRGG